MEPTPQTEEARPEQQAPTPPSPIKTASPERQLEASADATPKQQEETMNEVQEESATKSEEHVEHKEDSMETEQPKPQTPAKQQTATPSKPQAASTTKTPTPQPQKLQKTPSSVNSATKRKFDALHERNLQTEPTLQQHEQNKRARASTLTGSSTKQTKREFSFARPTASSASRTAAIVSAHAKATPPPVRTPIQSKRNHTPMRTNRAMSTEKTPKTPTTSSERRHFSYTPYSGPLPPLTVESSFAPKNGLNRGARTASPAVKAASAGRKAMPMAKVRNTTGKENVATNSVDADEPVNSKPHGSPLKASTVEEQANKETNLDAVTEAVSHAPTPETMVEPTA